MDLHSTIDANVCINVFEADYPLSTHRSDPFRFLNVGAGFALTKANLFPTEAARGGAQIVLVRESSPTLHDVYSREG
jgi:hypothetical protein